jgi:hypothetical protein
LWSGLCCGLLACYVGNGDADSCVFGQCGNKSEGRSGGRSDL